MSAVELREVFKSFGGQSVLENLSFGVPQNEGGKSPYVVLLGASGCGKTTTLRIIAGLDSPDSGSVWIGGQCVDRVPPRRRNVSLVFQQDALYPHLSVEQSLRLGRPGGPELESGMERAIQITGIESFLDRRPEGLSGGQLRRAAIARSIVRAAGVRLLDEPLSALDGPVRHELAADLRRWHDLLGGVTIHVTHDGDEAMRLADVVAVMDRGRIVQSASPTEILDRPQTIVVAQAIGSPPINIIHHDRVTLAVRPGSLRLVPSDAATPSGLRVRLDGDRDVRCRRVNDAWEVNVRLADQNIVAVLPRKQPDAPEIDPPSMVLTAGIADLHFFDLQSGQRTDGPKDFSWTI